MSEERRQEVAMLGGRAFRSVGRRGRGLVRITCAVTSCGSVAQSRKVSRLVVQQLLATIQSEVNDRVCRKGPRNRSPRPSLSS